MFYGLEIGTAILNVFLLVLGTLGILIGVGVVFLLLWLVFNGDG